MAAEVKDEVEEEEEEEKVSPNTMVESDSSDELLRSKGNNHWISGSGSHPEAKSSAMTRAEDVQANLGTEFPSFVKTMVRSHVSSSFWMRLPAAFCYSHLPGENACITLEDEIGARSEVKFIADKIALSGGWRRFSIEHNLLVGDVLVFQLIKPTKFKVYIIRENDLPEAEEALDLQNVEVPLTKNNSEVGSVACKNDQKKRSSSPLSPVVQKKNKRIDVLQSVSRLVQSAVKFENKSEVVGADARVGSNFCAPAAFQFDDISSLGTSSTSVNRMVICSKLAEHTREKYYELCNSQKVFLHEHLVKGINSTLIAGIISETVNIADALRACKLSTPVDDFSIWDKTLKAFELLGMNVGFLRARLQRLRNLTVEAESDINKVLYREAKTQNDCVEDKIRKIEAKLAELREARDRCSREIKALQSYAETHELTLVAAVNALW